MSNRRQRDQICLLQPGISVDGAVKQTVDIWWRISVRIPDWKETIYESGTRGGRSIRFVSSAARLGLYLLEDRSRPMAPVHTCQLAGKQSGKTTLFRVRFTSHYRTIDDDANQAALDRR
jgi:hypothetical protein